MTSTTHIAFSIIINGILAIILYKRAQKKKKINQGRKEDNPEADRQNPTQTISNVIDTNPEADRQNPTQTISKVIDTNPEADRQNPTQTIRKVIDTNPEADRQNPTQTISKVIDTNPELADDSIPNCMLRWTNYAVYIALIALVIGDCSLFFSNGLALVMKLFCSILSTGAIVALIYRFLTGFYEKYSSDTSLFNNSLHVASNIFFIAIPIASMSASCVSDFLTYDYYSIFSHYDAVIYIFKLNSVLNGVMSGFAAYYGYYLHTGFDGKLKKLGLSLMIFGVLAAILCIYGLFTELNPYDHYEGIMKFKSGEDILMIILTAFAYWVAMWPFRIMTKLLVNGETDPSSSLT